ncbi:putative hydroxypyruvate isomerase isoform X1 [Crotalus tigris]|uniref:putative hydroxypyruvate isomerase isoform X1 n=1 Tax=Crotalus tigris TaxID=88082 RepID=UPI00192F974D|nr:putative hydroxypyruvate isomerase isoform X1 [Crotalus tigris]
MAPLRFAANLAWLFQEEPALVQRMEAASRAGFRAVELGFPYTCSAPELRAAAERDGLEVVLLNTPPGNQEKGDMGLGAVPGRQAEFREALAVAVKYAKELKCPSLYKKQLTDLSSALMQLCAFRIHLMAGRFPTGAKRDAVSTEMEATFIENLRYAADILEQENLIGLLEPINNQISDPNYFLTTPQQAAAILEKVGSPSLKLQLDIFHCQIMNGNLTQNLKAYFPIIGHIQIAQVPGRHEPDSPGELNFPYLFQLLESMSYSGYIGCEYKPKGNTLDGLNWLYSYWEDHCVGKVGKKMK